MSQETTNAIVTVTDLHCDMCAILVTGPSGGAALGSGGVRFVYHPGRAQLRDNSGLLCERCWAQLADWLGPAGSPSRCAACDVPVARRSSLHLRRGDDLATWQLCRAHAVEFLNRLRTVEPKLDLATFRFPFADTDADLH